MAKFIYVCTVRLVLPCDGEINSYAGGIKINNECSYRHSRRVRWLVDLKAKKRLKKKESQCSTHITWYISTSPLFQRSNRMVRVKKAVSVAIFIQAILSLTLGFFYFINRLHVDCISRIQHTRGGGENLGLRPERIPIAS